ncbi:PqqD family protein [uncultured Draconibacterium sp.]|uniref:PqqD family protein n=1 Tax=uncultured Draconibacterium sp. TaxID=1573823 RepID=UPI0032172ED4
MKITDEIKISDNGFVFNSRTGDSFSLNPSGLQLLRDLEAGKDFDVIKTEMLERYDIDDLSLEKDFYEFFALLKHHQILTQEDPLNFQ